MMKIKSNSINEKGHFHDKHGKHGEKFLKGMPNHSVDFEIENAPEGTKSFAFILDDHDAIPVCGFTWIHWAGANLKKTKVSEGESENASDFVQGVNSWGAPMMGADALSREDASNYGGMAPPNCDHTYELRVYALDIDLNLENGFLVNELYNAMRGHILEVATLEGMYRN
ncbi:MAG: YbhB/YbcL family Raf kinase inhibitor-like protein [Clostridium sp.]|uniref:YbhB/YbcL family Raf kinase inhibitor-like protein n=1 Tax=Clostridium sp. TaxID=1506 RepID=UPI003F369DDE